jgi:hypothetical protein
MMGQVSVDKQTGVARIVLDTRLYGYGAVMQAGNDFSESCWVLVDGDKDDKLLVTLRPKLKEISLDNLAYEFSNYTLGLMQNAIF